MKKLMLLLAIAFLAGCQYLDGCVVHSAKVADVYQQAVAYGVLKGYAIKYQDQKNGLLSFKIADYVSSGESETRSYETQSSQYTKTSDKDEISKHDEKNKYDEKDKDKDIKANKDVVKSSISKTTTTPVTVSERGIAMQISQKGEDVFVKINTFGSGYGTGEAQDAISHFKSRWNVEPVYLEQ